MNRESKNYSWLVPTAAVVAMSFLMLLEWDSNEDLRNGLSRLASAAERQDDSHSERMDGSAIERQLSSLSSRMSRMQAGMRALQESLERVQDGVRSRDPSATDAETVAEAVAELEKPDPWARQRELAAQRFPDRSNLEPVIRDFDVEKFFEDPANNPDGIELNHREKAKAAAIVSSAKSEIELVKSRIQLAVIDAVEAMKDRGDFVDFDRGVAPDHRDGVLSAGEQLPSGGMRMYYFTPEDFPEIYRLGDERKEVAEIAVGRLMEITNP